ncbi:ankyrin repeat domain-containing protein [Spiroplasma endosymbiont of Acasis viretata]|uniref:ankyrin repeat domain-containing protein n=1 Tax=Spiroplasma endosymbiont of Acasis viretata TaxID=3066306 RepID=UPI00313E3BBA
MLNINDEEVLFDSKYIQVKKTIKNGFIHVEEPWCNNQGVAILPYVLKDNEYYFLQIHNEKNPAHEISKISQYSTITGGLETMDYYTTVVKEMWEETGIDISGNNVVIDKFNWSFANKSSNKKWFLYAIDLTNLNLNITKTYYGKGGDGTYFEKDIHAKFINSFTLVSTGDILSTSIWGKLNLFKKYKEKQYQNFLKKIEDKLLTTNNLNQKINLRLLFDEKFLNNELYVKNTKETTSIPTGFPLHYAVDNGYFEIAKLLLEKGADPNIKDVGGTPLQIAVSNFNNNIEIVKLLLENDADINIQNKYGNNTILDVLFKNNKIEIIKEILIKKIINDYNEKKYIDILLIYFSKYNDILSFKWLNENFKIDSNIEDKETFCSPLYYAVNNNNIEIVKLLLENDADINEQDINGSTPLHWAIECNNIEIVKLLLENDADINEQDINGCAPLHWAIECNNIEIVKLLLENDADINAQEKSLATPLHLSIYTNNFDMIKLLLEKGADLNIKDIGEFTTLNVLLKKYNISSEISQLLFKQLNFKKNIKRKFLKKELTNSTKSKLPKLIFEKEEINAINLQNQPSTSKTQSSSSKSQKM